MAKNENKKKRILLTGASGLLGSNLASVLKDFFGVLGLYHSHEIFLEGVEMQGADLSKPETLKKVIDRFGPDILIHSAALANVERCESERALARKINVEGTKNVVQSLKGSDAKLIFISTDSVYDGQKGDFRESDPVKPLSHYSQTKYEGEQEALKRANALVLRTSFFGWNLIPGKMNLGEEVIHNLSRKIPMKGFTDVYTSFLYTLTLARLLPKIIEKNLQGIFNCASRNFISKYEFAVSIANHLGLDKNFLAPASIEDFGFKAKRSKNLTLNTEKLRAALGEELSSVEDSIRAFCADFNGRVPMKLKEGRGLFTVPQKKENR